MKIFVTIIAILIKVLLFIVIMNYGLHKYSPINPLYKQSLWVWICIYLPFAMGLESFLSSILSSKIRKRSLRR